MRFVDKEKFVRIGVCVVVYMDLKGLSNSLGSTVTVVLHTVHISRELLRSFLFVLLCILLRLRFCLF